MLLLLLMVGILKGGVTQMMKTTSLMVGGQAIGRPVAEVEVKEDVTIMDVVVDAQVVKRGVGTLLKMRDLCLYQRKNGTLSIRKLVTSGNRMNCRKFVITRTAWVVVSLDIH